MAGISFNIARKELKIAQIAQLNQLFQLLHLVHIYGHSFYELSRMLMRKNVNNDVSRDSPIRQRLAHIVCFSTSNHGNCLGNPSPSYFITDNLNVKCFTYITTTVFEPNDVRMGR